MRRLALLLLALVACESGSDLMPQELKIPVRGLYTSPNEHGEVPAGALARAEDIVVEDGAAKPRRGFLEAVGSPASSLVPYRGVLVLHDGTTLSATDAGLTLATAYEGSVSAPTSRRVRFAESNGNLYLTTSLGIRKLDAAGGDVMPAGVPPGLDVQATVTGSSGFLDDDTAVAYRMVWGTRDANGNLILGAPSGRTILANGEGGARDAIVSTSIPSGIDASRHFWQLYRTAPSETADIDPGDEMGLVYEGAPPEPVTITQLARSSNVVTATATGHGYAVGQIVRVSPGGATSSTTGVAVGSAGATLTTDGGATWSAAGISGITSANAVVWGGAQYVAVGASSAYTSPDGLTWTSRTIPAGTYHAVVWTGTQYVAVGENACATSPDGETWTDRTILAGLYYGLAWNGSVLVAVGAATFGAAAAVSSDGVTWSARYMAPGAIYYGIIWTGTHFDARGTKNAWSPDGNSWSFGTSPNSPAVRTLAWTGEKRVVVFGPGANGSFVTWTADGTTYWGGYWLPNDEFYALGWNGTNLVAVGTDVAYTSADAQAWTEGTIGAGTWKGVAFQASASFAASECTIATVPDADSFTYAETGADGTLVQNQTATPLTVAITDQIPSTFAGATLYSSPSQQGLLASRYEPPAARDLAFFRGSAFWLGTTDRTSLEFFLLAAGAPAGVQANDTITINGQVFTAKANESIGSREFAVVTSGTAAENVRDTAASLIRVVNRAQGASVYARDQSGANDIPGRILLTARTLGDSIAVSVSRSTSWVFTDGQTKASETKANRVMWSPQGMPEAAQVTAYSDLGSATRDALRVIALRDSAFVLKADGVWRLTGDRFDYQSAPVVQPFDTTTEIVGAGTPVALDNIIFALSNKGIVQISDTGVTIISGPIWDQIAPLLVGDMRAAVESLAEGISYESDGKYILFVPTESSDTQPTRAFVYDHFESLQQGAPVWTTWTIDAKCGTVNPADGKLYLGTATNLLGERKALDYTDHADGEFSVTVNTTATTATVVLADAANALVGDMLVKGSAVGIVLSKNGNTLTLDRSAAWSSGAGTVYRAIPTVTQFAPAIPGRGGWVAWNEATFLFRYLSGGYMEPAFATEFVPTFTAIPVYGTRDYSLSETALVPFNLRTLVDRDHARSARLSVRFSHTQARSPFALEGLSLIFTPTGIRLNR